MTIVVTDRAQVSSGQWLRAMVAGVFYFASRMTRLITAIILCALASVTAHAAADESRPNVRTITAFVRLDRSMYERQIEEAMRVLSAARAEFARRGYATQTVRIVTQPLAELVKGLSDTQALSFLRSLDDLSQKDGFMPNVGPAMLHDTDDPAVMRLLAQVLSTLPHLNASAIIADEDGIHWKTIRESAKLVRYVADHSEHSQGTFLFAATAMLKPLGPFYPGAYHLGAGRQFSLGFEGAGVVQRVFRSTHGDFIASVAELTRQLTIHARVGEEEVPAKKARPWPPAARAPRTKPRMIGHRRIGLPRHAALHRRPGPTYRAAGGCSGG